MTTRNVEWNVDLVRGLRGAITHPRDYDVPQLVKDAADEIERLGTAISDGSPAWRDAANDPPDNEQKVLACWRGPSCVEGMETLVYRGPEGSDDPECWFDVWSDVRDAPTHWMSLPEPPK